VKGTYEFMKSPDFTPPSPILTDPREVRLRLKQFDLETEAFEIAATKGLAAWLDTTENDPPTFPGTAAWAATTRSIREELITSGWGMRRNEMNVALIINEAMTMAIAVASGDDQTGRLSGFPCTRSPKGPATEQAVRENSRQQKFEFMIPEVVESTRVSGRSTWIFLIHRDTGAHELRFELSRPTSISKDGYVDEWAERIIFTAKPFGSDEAKTRGNGGNNGDNGQSPEIIVEIRKLK
jgi:hypothetical protein